MQAVEIVPNRIYQGDCVKRMNGLPAGSVDLVFADPPFNIGYEYDQYNDRRERDEYLDWSRKWIACVSRVLKPNGSFWLAIGDEYAAELKLIAQDEAAFTCRSWVLWYYTFGVNCVRGFSRSHTHLFHFVKDPTDFTFNSENPLVRVLSARQLVYADNRANPKGRLPDNTWILRPQDAPPSSFAPMHDTWYFARVAGTFKEREGFHGCQMPEQLLGRIIRVSSNPTDLVLDPFTGSGTTLAAAKKLGRQWIGFEMSREYAKRAQQRVTNAQVGDPLDGPEDPLQSSPATSKGMSKLRLRKGRPIPTADVETQRAVIEAFRITSNGISADSLLCDPQLNRDFVKACKQSGVPGNAYLWNRLLLRIRKAGKLPKAERPQKRLTFEMMDSYSVGSEIAMQWLGLDYGMRLDDILCQPSVANELDRIAAMFAPGHCSSEYRWAALSIRKRANKSKALATQRFGEWLERELPKSMPLESVTGDDFAVPGVYILTGSGQSLYVGETTNFRRRVEQVLQSEAWTRLGTKSVQFIPTGEPQIQHGLQSMLVLRTRPLLNSHLLLPDF
jgi:DNA modification methylase